MPTVNVFYCYAREDLALRDELDKHLGPMKRQSQLTSWYDRDINAGKLWANEIDSHLNAANIFLLLISPDFMNSDYCYSTEMQYALQRQESGDARVIPIILRTVDWEHAPFSKLQVLPTGGIPAMSWKSLDEAFTNVAKELRKVVREMLAEQLQSEDFYGFLDKRYLEALAAYEQAIELDSHNAPAFRNKGAALYALKRYNEALKAYDEAAQLDPDNAMTHHGKGRTLQKLQLHEEALFAYDQAIRLDPNLAEAYRDKAVLLEALALQARNKADEIESRQTKAPTFSLNQERDGSLIRLGEMISSGKIHIGERVYVNKQPDQLAKIVDGRRVEYNGKTIFINEWARKMADWPSINIYSNVYLERTK